MAGRPRLSVRLRVFVTLTIMRYSFVRSVAWTITLVTIAMYAGGVARTEVFRIRPLDSRVATLLAEGSRRSSTFCGLVAALGKTDLIVLVQLTRLDPTRQFGGGLRFMAATPNARFLIIMISRDLTSTLQISTLGHELQHAIEIAQHPEVTSQAALRDLYERIGDCRRDGRFCDSAAARDVESRIRAELLQ